MLAALGIGDLVRIHGHGILRKTFERDRERWQFSEIPAAGVTLAERSTCCAAPPPQAATPDGGAGEVPDASGAVPD